MCAAVMRTPQFSDSLPTRKRITDLPRLLR